MTDLTNLDRTVERINRLIDTIATDESAPVGYRSAALNDVSIYADYTCLEMVHSDETATHIEEDE
jgi:hypothetical protein